MTTRALLIDALGTMVELEPPWVRLAEALDTEPNEALVRAVRAEMAYYKEHAHEGRDAESLADLRGRCAAILSEGLGREIPVETMMDAIRFRAYDDAAPALRAVRAGGVLTICVSNWDISLADVLADCGLAELLDGVVSSAEVGARKPDPAIFARALELAGCAPAEALHVGDTPAEDIAGARAAGIPALLIDRSGRDGDLRTLAELPERVLA
ncbi:MAG TPA: HAD family hydrolase [Solirubrobacterales bacterium]|jgi:putative hydrolase of the HAD superfamily